MYLEKLRNVVCLWYMIGFFFIYLVILWINFICNREFRKLGVLKILDRYNIKNYEFDNLI